MSGGHFEYWQHHITDVADIIERRIEDNDSTERNAWGDPIGRGYQPEIIAHFRAAVSSLRRSAVYAQEIDWLLSGDAGPESFLRRIHKELEALKS